MIHDDVIRANAIARPRFRGVLHTWFFVISLPAGIGLVASAPAGRAMFAAWIFAFSTTAMLGISALFHRTSFDDHGWYRFRRLDHVGIYLCIAGGFTPIGMLVLDDWQRILLLVAGWVGASLGIILRFAPFRPPYGMMNALFITLAWSSLLTAPAMWRELGPTTCLWIAFGGALYTVGALVVGSRWPDPWPRTFGYHEIWHTFVVLAAITHYIVMWVEIIPRG